MLKRLSFVHRRRGLSPCAFGPAWVLASAQLCAAPRPARPVRGVACIAIADMLDSPPSHHAISMLWFSDQGALQAYEAWLHSAEGGRLQAALDELQDPGSAAVIVAEEAVMRGQAWLSERFRTADAKLKHMALARRAEGLSRAELAERWRARTGRIGGAAGGAVVQIPEAAKGDAYVQNHPVPSDAEPLYDAINEVYFDDLRGLRTRIDFFRTHDVARVDADLFREPRFLVVCEHDISTRRADNAGGCDGTASAGPS